MAEVRKPASMALERWMRVSGVGGLDLFVFSGYAFFWTPPEQGGPDGDIRGQGAMDSDDQKNYVDFEITDMLVGPHWDAVREVCPMVVASGHDQIGPDESDYMGHEVFAIKRINVVSQGAFSRIELQVGCKVRGGWAGSIPSLAYHVTALGQLSKDIGDEGVFFSGQP